MTMQMIRIIEEFVGKNLWEFILVNIIVFYPCMYIISNIFFYPCMYIIFFICFAPYTNTNSRYEYEYEYTNRCEYDY